MIEFLVQPQRASGSGFIPCEPHQAQRFAVIRKETYYKNKRKLRVMRTLSSYPTLAEAEDARLTNERNASKFGHNYKLGQRILKRETI
jgi:hypothetical protein